MVCPRCKSNQITCIDSRPSGDTTRRRRMCLDCKVRFTTMEVPEFEYKDLKGKEKLLGVMLKTATDIIGKVDWDGKEA